MATDQGVWSAVHLIVCREQNVLGFDVAVDDAIPLQRIFDVICPEYGCFVLVVHAWSIDPPLLQALASTAWCSCSGKATKHVSLSADQLSESMILKVSSALLDLLLLGRAGSQDDLVQVHKRQKHLPSKLGSTSQCPGSWLPTTRHIPK